MVAGSITGCGSATRPPDGDATNKSATSANPAAIDTPLQVARFKRMDILRRNDNTDVTAGYALGEGADAIIATVRVHAVASAGLIPLLGGERIADSSASAQPLQDAITQVRHYYPDAALRNVRAVYLVKRGVLQSGRAATLRYEDLFAGQRQKIDLDIYMFCCVDDGMAYEFRIRHAADNNAAWAAIPFLQALDWSVPSRPDDR